MSSRISLRIGIVVLAAALCTGAALVDDSKPDAKNSYKSVKRNGVELYCRTGPVTPAPRRGKPA